MYILYARLSNKKKNKIFLYKLIENNNIPIILEIVQAYSSYTSNPIKIVPIKLCYFVLMLYFERFLTKRNSLNFLI